MLKIFRSTIIVLLSFLVLVVPKYSIADLQSSDDPIFGLDAIIYDTETGLEWLNLTFSEELSYLEVIDEMKPGGYFEGFRYATTTEIEDLYLHAGVPLIGWSTDTSIVDACVNFADLLGPTGTRFDHPAISGMSESCDFTQYPYMCVGYGLNYVFIPGAEGYNSYQNVYDAELQYSGIGHWLVRPADRLAASLNRLSALIDMIMDLNIPSGISNSLNSKLSAVSQALDNLNEKNYGSAINGLQAFINAVEAQRSKRIPDADADDLIASAQAIMDMLNYQ